MKCKLIKCFLFITIIILLMAGIYFLGSTHKVKKSKIETISIELYKLAKPETETYQGYLDRLSELSQTYDKSDVKSAKKFIQDNAKAFLDTIDGCNECVISVEIDNITSLDKDSYIADIRLVNTLDDTVKSEFPIELDIKFMVNSAKVSLSKYVPQKDTK